MAQERLLPDLVSKIAMSTAAVDQAEAHVKTTTSKMGGHLGGLGNITKDTEKKIGALGTQLSGLGPLGAKAGTGINAAMGALTAGLGPTVLAGAAISAAGVFVYSGMQKYLALAGAVENYSSVTGESVAQSSKQVQAFAELGVKSDVAEQAVFKLSKAIDQQPKKLEMLGIAVARDAKGNTDLNATLLNVIDAYNGTEDAGKKNTIVLTAFGKSGLDLLPILEAGSSKLRQLEADVRVTLTDADIAQAHKYALQTRELGLSWDAFGENIGRNVVPVLLTVTEHFNRQEYVDKRLKEAMDNGLSPAFDRTTTRGKELVAVFEKQYDATQTANMGLQSTADTLQQATAKADALEKALAKDNQQMQTMADQGLSLAHAMLSEERGAENVTTAQLNYKKAIQTVEQAQDNYNVTVRKYGRASEQAQAALLALQQAQQAQKQSNLSLRETYLSQLDSIIAVAKGQQKLAEDTAIATGNALSASESHDKLILSLDAEAAKLAPGSDLRKQLEGYTNQLRSADAAAVSLNNDISTFSSGYSGPSTGGGQHARASGGPMLPGQIYTVGEEGPETAVMGQRGGYIVPNAGGGGGGGRPVVVHSHLYLDGKQIDEHVQTVIAGPGGQAAANRGFIARNRGLAGAGA